MLWRQDEVVRDGASPVAPSVEGPFCRRESMFGGRFYLYALAGAGQAGVEGALESLRAEIERDMKLDGLLVRRRTCRDNLRWR